MKIDYVLVLSIKGCIFWGISSSGETIEKQHLSEFCNAIIQLKENL